MSDTPGAGIRPAPQQSGPLEELVHSRDPEVLRALAANPHLTEELALALLTRRDLPPPALEALAKNAALTRRRKVIVALVSHPRTPRHLSLPITRHLYTFELMRIALLPAIAADLKVSVEEALIARLESISSGERITLARRGSTRVAAALLCDPEERVRLAALENPHMTEEWIVKALAKDEAPVPLLHAVARHPKWSLRRDIQLALLRHPSTPLAHAIAIADKLPTPVLRDLLTQSHLQPGIRAYFLSLLHRRTQSLNH